jgi:hypothetical protein
MTDGALILKSDHKPVVRVEIARSFSYKLNIPGAYESRDFFCSEKAECAIEDAPEVSAALFGFCRAEVLRSVGEYIKEMKQQRQAALGDETRLQRQSASKEKIG